MFFYFLFYFIDNMGKGCIGASGLFVFLVNSPFCFT